MEPTAKEPPELEKRPPKPPLKPKPPALARAVGTQGDGSQRAGEAQPAYPPVPARRQVLETTAAGEVCRSSGNVRKIRERFDKASGPREAEGAVSGEKQPLGVRRSESAREAPGGTPPVPKARRKHMVRSVALPEALVNHSKDQALLAPARPPLAVPLTQDNPTDPREEEEEEAPEGGDEVEGGTEDGQCCPTRCPCLCHRERPGMVLVWRPAPDAEGRLEISEPSLSDSSESSDNKTFSYVLPIGGEANHCPDFRISGINPEASGAEAPTEPAETAIPEAPRQPDGGHGSSETAGPGRESPAPATNPLPKPPRRNKPVRQSSLDGGDGPPPRLPTRRLAQVRRSGQAPAGIRGRFTAGDLDKLSQCVDRLNLHVRKPVVPSQGFLPPPLRPVAGACLELPSPTVTRSAPPSPKEKRLQPTYDQVDAGEEENSRSNVYELHLDILERRSSKSESGNVKDWESRFESEPLYQTYRDTVIHREIKRQTLMRDSSRTSEDYMYESIPLIPDTERADSSLWQNLSAVRQSGILDTLSKEERRQQESMFEVLTSEASYLRSLNILIEHFMNSRDLNNTIILRDKKTLFSCIVRVQEVSESFLKDLEERVDESIKIRDVCDIIYSHALQNFQVYVDYVRNQFYQEQKYSQLMEENPQFAAVVVRLQELPHCQRLPLMSFLLLPFQRITRIKMLIENILQKSEVGSANEETASKALSVVSKIIEDCNREVGIMRQMEEMIHIAKKLEFDKLKAIPIISQLRHLEKQGEVSEIVLRGNLFGVKPKVNLLYFFLFNDLLLITTRKGGDRYQVVDYAHRSLVEVEECSINSLGASIGNCFMLTLLENHQGKQCERLLKALTESDRHRWMNALTSGKYALEEETKDDKIYECWDCPQVQCLVPYTAQQADELSLEPADIINVTKKSPEGWYEGSKLSNGQKGWFPSENVQEITNEHVRRRNLRERYRLLQAAQHLHQKQDGAGREKANNSL